MRLPSTPSVHLAYCSNIHPGESWVETFTNLELYVPALRRTLSPDHEFGIGLRLSDQASRELNEGRQLSRFRRWLDEQGLYVFTVNGFPYGGFHRTVVKDAVYRPDWTSEERVAYTCRLADILAELLPQGLEGGISTSPVSYKRWHDERDYAGVFERAAFNLARVAAYLAELNSRRGRLIHLDLEPEPDCLIENTQETLDFFVHSLLPRGSEALVDRLGMSPDEARRRLLDHVQVCYDACHFAVEFEDPSRALARLTESGLKIGKVQISSALSVDLSGEETLRTLRLGRLQAFAESTYLHQVIERRAGGALRRYPDLPDALAAGPSADALEWRIHFHVPIFVEHYAEIGSTRDDLERCLRIVKEKQLSRHLEIETYTWEVLPGDLKVRLSSSIAREYEWVLSVLEPGPVPIESEPSNR